MEEERKKLRVIHVFDNGEDAAIEMAGRSDKTITPPGISCAMGEQQVLMNVAFHVYFYLFKYEAGEISKTELDLYLRTSPLPPKVLVNAHPLDFNFVLVSTINGCTYTSRLCYIDEKDLDDTHSKILELYSELSIMYSFDSIIDQIQKMVADFKAAHEDFDNMTQDERVERFCSWNRSKEYMKEVFFVSLLDKCRKIYAILNHEYRRKKGGH